MPHITVLKKEVSELIAAGEVIERPASVIKELVENAIDAGAKHITVEIQHGGTTFMRIVDDGCGMAPEEVPTAFLRHATSKITRKEDLDRIFTLGFRGKRWLPLLRYQRFLSSPNAGRMPTAPAFRLPAVCREKRNRPAVRTEPR